MQPNNMLYNLITNNGKKQIDNDKGKEIKKDKSNTPSMVPAVCTRCGAALDVNPKRKAAFCSYCGTQYSVGEGFEFEKIHQRSKAEHAKSTKNDRVNTIIGLIVVVAVLIALFGLFGKKESKENALTSETTVESTSEPMEDISSDKEDVKSDENEDVIIAKSNLDAFYIELTNGGNDNKDHIEEIAEKHGLFVRKDSFTGTYHYKVALTEEAAKDAISPSRIDTHGDIYVVIVVDYDGVKKKEVMECRYVNKNIPMEAYYNEYDGHSVFDYNRLTPTIDGGRTLKVDSAEDVVSYTPYIEQEISPMETLFTQLKPGMEYGEIGVMIEDAGLVRGMNGCISYGFQSSWEEGSCIKVQYSNDILIDISYYDYPSYKTAGAYIHYASEKNTEQYPDWFSRGVGYYVGSRDSYEFTESGEEAIEIYRQYKREFEEARDGAR